jgi:hypothetical protein
MYIVDFEKRWVSYCDRFKNFELLISSDLYVLRSPEHVYEVFRMMSVCASVRLSVPLLVLPPLLKNAKNALTDCFLI